MSVMQIEPAVSNGGDAANFRQLKESRSLHLEDETRGGMEDELDGDLFEAFSSVSLHYDGET
jgi:protein-serine/threonine kinase